MLYIYGFITGALVLHAWKGRGFSVPQSILLLIGLVLLSLTLDNYTAFGRELEPAAQQFALISLGIPGLVLVIIALLLRNVAKKRLASVIGSAIR